MAEPATWLRLEAAPTRETIELVHDLVAELWHRRPDVTMIDRIRFETAVIEIVGNVVEHAWAVDDVEERRFDISIGIEDGTLVATMNDNGRPHELDFSRVTMPDTDAESGRGLALAASTVDDLQYTRDGPINRWRIVSRQTG